MRAAPDSSNAASCHRLRLAANARSYSSPTHFSCCGSMGGVDGAMNVFGSEARKVRSTSSSWAGWSSCAATASPFLSPFCTAWCALSGRPPPSVGTSL